MKDFKAEATEEKKRNQILKEEYDKVLASFKSL